jgi:hypothetical protein
MMPRGGGGGGTSNGDIGTPRRSHLAPLFYEVEGHLAHGERAQAVYAMGILAARIRDATIVAHGARFLRGGRQPGAVNALTRVLRGIAAAGDVKNRPALHTRLDALADDQDHPIVTEIWLYDPGRTPPDEMVLWTDDSQRAHRTSFDHVWRTYRDILQGKTRSRRRASV